MKMPGVEQAIRSLAREYIERAIEWEELEDYVRNHDGVILMYDGTTFCLISGTDRNKHGARTSQARTLTKAFQLLRRA